MSKITIVGISGAGKTCYMIGMFSKMLRGASGFTLTTSKDFQRIRRMMQRLGDKKLPVKDRFPAASDQVERYELSLKYALKEIEEIEWIDYPGGNFSDNDLHDEVNKEFCEHVVTSDCLFLCVDGSAFVEEETDEIINELNYFQGGNEINNLLNNVAGATNGELPKICIIITKYDKIPEDKRNEEMLYNVVSQIFTVLFENTDSNERVVGICPVSLGKDFETEGVLKLNNMEKPIFFATFFGITAKLIMNRENLNLSQSELKQLSGGKLKNWMNKGERSRAQANISKYEAVASELVNELERVKKEISMMPLYVNGKRVDWDSV